MEEILNKEALRCLEFLEIEFGNGGILSSEGFISFLYDTIRQKTFEQLQIPLKVTGCGWMAAL
ncbi:MAG: hypothetical protein RRB22_09965 [Gammaproteobacteria bacterium]|nr:hypothetical protein [Gammaproteobacteria bacterium]